MTQAAQAPHDLKMTTYGESYRSKMILIHFDRDAERWIAVVDGKRMHAKSYAGALMRGKGYVDGTLGDEEPGGWARVEAPSTAETKAADFSTKEEALTSAKDQGRKKKDVFYAHGRWHVAAEPPSAKENPIASSAGNFTTVERDPADLAAGKKYGRFENARSVYNALHEQMMKESQEVFLVLPLDLHGEMLCAPVEVARGQRDQVALDHADMLRPLVSTNAMGVILVHCHPSSGGHPSEADKRLTADFKKALAVALPGVVFVDHIVFGVSSKKGSKGGAVGEFYSFTDGKKYSG